MTATEKICVLLTIRTKAGEDTLLFPGTGELTLQGEKTHLHYEVKTPEGEMLRASVHTGAGKISVDNGAYKMLLDTKRDTHCSIPTEGGNLEMDVVTHEAEHHWDGERGQYRMRYSLYAMGRILQDFDVEIELRRS